MELAFITGASSGIGAAIEAHAGEQGVVTATMSRHPGDGRFTLAVDLSDPEAWLDTVEWVGEVISEVAPDRVSFYHCAATLDPVGFAGEVDLESYARNVALNSAGPQVLGAGVIGALIEASVPGVLVQISSGAATKAYPGWSSYCAAKAAVEHWTRTVGAELAERGRDITVIAVAPGVVDTPMQAVARSVAEDQLPNVDRFRALRRDGELADPDEVAARLWALARDPELENGAVLDLRDFEG